ncbi:MAG: reverse gyrase [Thermosphaera sp.]
MSDLQHPYGIYRHACPNCGREISDYRLLHKAPCEKCLDETAFKKVLRKLRKKKTHRYGDVIEAYYEKLQEPLGLTEIIREEKTLEDFERFFEKATNGNTLWSAQRSWARRIFKKRSFSIIAPTGTGKTVFSIIMSLYLTVKAKENGESRRIYLVFPTLPILYQAESKLRFFASNVGLNICSEESDDNCIRILVPHGKLKKELRDALIQRLTNGDFDILLSTNAFFHKYFDFLKDKDFSLIIMDDVDAVLKSGRAVRRVLALVGVPEGAIDDGLNLIKLRQKLAYASSEEKPTIINEIEVLSRKIEEIKSRINTTLVVNSATGRPRGIYPKLFKVFLDFEAGSKPEAIRNIIDAYVETEDVERSLINIAEVLKDGFLVFVPIDKGIEYAEKVAEKLRDAGFECESFHARKSAEVLNDFASGKLKCLVGVATYYGVMVRGVDLPERVKYVVFLGVPRHKISTSLEEIHPRDLVKILGTLREVFPEEARRDVEVLIGRLASRLRRLSQGALFRLREDFSKKIKGEPVEETPLLRDLLKAYEIARDLLNKEETWEKLSKLEDIGFIKENNRQYLLIPDVATYIQASGRSSRLYPGGITKGLSIIIVDDRRLLNGLNRRLRWIFEGLSISKLEELDFAKIAEEISEERRMVGKILRGEHRISGTVDLIKSALLIVESPNKAKTIANFFGKPSVRVLGKNLQAYEVTIGDYVLTIIASGGHVYDLVTDINENYGVKAFDSIYVPVYTDIKRCGNGHQFVDEVNACPRCGLGIINRKLDVLRALKELAREVDVVLIGTDPDAEGEKIGWDLRVLLEPYAREIRRIEFHEVTRKAILDAIRNPRPFDTRLVGAQIVRRVEDRWIGFSLSEKVQKYGWLSYCIKHLRDKGFDCCIENRNLSAGRVQTPVLGYVIERYFEKSRKELFKYKVVFEKDGVELAFTLNRDQAVNSGISIFLEDPNLRRKRNKEFPSIRVRVVDEVPETVNPLPPFTTDSLLEEASKTLGLTTTRTMEIAQDLFEMGLITYHRTDSTRVSEAGVLIARQYLEEKYGTGFERFFNPRTWGAGGAHEAIRPTRPIDADRLMELVREGVIVLTGRFTKQHFLVYDLIFRRFIASQMKPAVVRKQILSVELNGVEALIERYIEIIENGFLDTYSYIRIETPVTEGIGTIKEIIEVKPPLARYHDVIRWMKEQGIGRPSTYAKVIQTLLDRRYVEATKKLKALRPTERGILIHDFLVKNFGDVVSVETTRKLEKDMKEIEEGKTAYQDVLGRLHRELREKILENPINNELEKQYAEICRKGA